MKIYNMNCFTCDARWPSKLKTGMVCSLVETKEGLVLIDTGPGREDYANPSGILRLFRIITMLKYDLQEAAYYQVKQLGFNPEDVKHIILTHMHFDHCGGLPDFPQATVHVHRREYEAFTGKMQNWRDFAYVQRHIAHVTEWKLYGDEIEKWYEFDAIRMPFDPEIFLIPLHGHSAGHCGVAVKVRNGWFFQAADAGAVYNDSAPAWLIRSVLGPHDAHLREFTHSHPEVKVSNSHMFPEWFEPNKQLA